MRICLTRRRTRSLVPCIIRRVESVEHVFFFFDRSIHAFIDLLTRLAVRYDCCCCQRSTDRGGAESGSSAH